MLYLSKASLIYALTPIFLVPRSITNFTDDHHHYTYPHVGGVLIYIILIDLAIIRGQKFEFRYMYFCSFSEYFGCVNFFCVDNCVGRRIFVSHIKVLFK